MATSLEEASEQLENTGQIELECQLVQEQLITLTTARNELLREFEQLIGGSARLLLQIQEDSTPASERKLHKYEAQKRLLEEKLSSLETELRTKAEKLADLDSKAGDYLLKVSSSGCFTEEDDEELSIEGQEMLREAVLAEMLNAEINAEGNLEGAVAVIDSSSDAELCAYNVKENGKLIDLDELNNQNNISEDTVDAFFSDSISVKPTNNSVENETNEIPKNGECVENDITASKWRQPSSELPSSEVEEAVPSGVPGKTVESLTGTETGATTQEIEASDPIVNYASNTVVESLTGTEIAGPPQEIEASSPIINDVDITAVESLTGTETTIAAATQDIETTSPIVNGTDNTDKDSNTTIVEEKNAVEVVKDIVTTNEVIDKTITSQSVQDVTVDISSKDSILEESKDKINNTLTTADDQNTVNETAVANVESAICEQNKGPVEESQTLPKVISSKIESTQFEVSGKERSLAITEESVLVGVISETLSEESLKNSDLIAAEVASSMVPVVTNGIEETISIPLTRQDLSQNIEKIEEKSSDASVTLPSESDLTVGTPSTLSKQSSTATELAETLSEESSAATESTLSEESYAAIELTDTLSEGSSATTESTTLSEESLVATKSTTLSEEISAANDMSETVASTVAPVVLNEIEESVATSLVQCALSQCIGKTEEKSVDASSVHPFDSVSVVEVSSDLSVESSTATDVTSEAEVAPSVVPGDSGGSEESITKLLCQSVLSQDIEQIEEKSCDISLTLASESVSDSIEENGSKTLLKSGQSESEASNIEVEENKPTEQVISKTSNILLNDVENSALSISKVTGSSCSVEDAPKAPKVTSGSDSPVQDQMASLASLVSDLRRVKEDMGKCMSVKEQSFIDLEDQLEATKAELALVKESMEKMTNVIKQKDETCQKMEEENKSKKIDIELKIKDIQEVTNKCSMLQTEKHEVLCKMEVLEIMMTEYRTEIELLVTEKTKIEEETRQLLAAKQAAATAQAEIDSQPTTELENEKPLENGDVIQNSETVVTTVSVKEEVSTSQISITEVSEEIPRVAELTHEENSDSIIKEKEAEPEKPTEEELQSLQKAVDEINATAPAIYKDVNTKDFNVQYDINEEIEILRTKVESLEKEKKEAMNKLKVNNKHLKIMDKDRKHKQRECELLRTKVEKVELKMCELQGTFDVLVKAIMNERDELIREVEEKSSQLTQLDASLTQIKQQYEQEIEKVQTQMKGIESELEKYQSGQLVSNTSVVDSTELEAAKAENERLSALLAKKTEETQEMISKNQEVHKEMQDFVNFLKEERTRLQQETDRAEKEKDFIQDTFNVLQVEHTQVTNTNDTLEKSVASLEAAQKEKDNTLERITLQLEDLQKQLEDLNTKNFNLTSEMYQKDEEYKEELSAREGTIQELNTTLTNNQKQSRDNYNQLQEDMTELETRLTTSLKESQAFYRELEGKMKDLEENKNREIQGLQSHITTIRESKEKVVEEKAVIYEKLLQTQSTMLRRASANKEEASTQIEDGDSPCETSSAVSLESISEEATSPDQKLLSQNEDKVPYDGQERIRALTTELESMRSNWQHGQEEKQREAMENEEKCKSPNNTDFGSQEEFEQLIRVKEAKISDLEVKVNELESTLVSKNGYIAELEGKLETSSEIKEVRQTVEAQVEQINKLSEDITKLKEELEHTYKECAALKNTVDQLENTKQSITAEKDNLVKAYEEKLQQAGGNLDQANADIELKKKLG